MKTSHSVMTAMACAPGEGWGGRRVRTVMSMCAGEGGWEAEGEGGRGGGMRACAAEIGVVLDLHLVDLLLAQVEVHLLARHLGVEDREQRVLLEQLVAHLGRWGGGGVRLRVRVRARVGVRAGAERGAHSLAGVPFRGRERAGRGSG